MSEPQTHPTGPAADGPEDLECSARGCRARAAWGLRWNNPRLHTADRRKVWLACAEHREHLEGFLAARGLYKDTVAVAELLSGPAADADRP